MTKQKAYKNEEHKEPGKLATALAGFARMNGITIQEVPALLKQGSATGLDDEEPDLRLSAIPDEPGQRL